MHVSAEIGRDPCVCRGCGRGRKVDSESSQRHVVAALSGRAYVVEIYEGVVLLRVGVRIPTQACRWHRFHVRLPGTPRWNNAVRDDIWSGDETRCAICVDAKRIATHERKIVWQAGMCD